MIIAAAALLAANLAMGIVARHAAIRLSLATTVLIGLSLAVQVVGVFWLEGLWMSQWMPNLNVLFKAYLDLLAILALCFAVWLTPLAQWAGARMPPRKSAH